MSHCKAAPGVPVFCGQCDTSEGLPLFICTVTSQHKAPMGCIGNVHITTSGAARSTYCHVLDRPSSITCYMALWRWRPSAESSAQTPISQDRWKIITTNRVLGACSAATASHVWLRHALTGVASRLLYQGTQTGGFCSPGVDRLLLAGFVATPPGAAPAVAAGWVAG